MSAPKEILDLVARFGLHRQSYTSGQCNETQLRREFIDPFFKCLGWDVENAAGLAEAYIHSWRSLELPYRVPDLKDAHR